MPFNWFKRQFGGKKKDEEETKRPSPSESPKAGSPAPTDAAQPDQDAPTLDTAPTQADDYLQWAKAAYQSIQQQSQPEEAAPDTGSDTAPDPAAATAPAPQADETEPEPTAEALSETPTPFEPEPAADAPTPPIAQAAPEPAVVEPTSGQPEVDKPEVDAPENADSETTDAIKPAAASPAPPTTDVAATAPEPPQAPDQALEGVADTAPAPEPPTVMAAEPDEPSPDTTPDAAPDTSTALPFWAQASAEREERLERLQETAIEEEPEPEPSADGVALDEDFVWSAGVLASQGRRPDEVSAEEITWLTKLRQGLGKTRRGLINQLKSVVGQGPLNAEAVMEIESLLLQADVGIDATDYVIESLQNRMKDGALPSEEAIAYLKEILRSILDKPFESDYAEDFVPEKDCLNIWLLTGVNGAGKTTTIGKLAHMTRSSDYRCLIAAADTFRAAAVEQVQAWGDRSGVDVIANPGKNTDPAAVVFDAITAAQARDVEVLLVDTAGRLQNKKNLMDELSKIRRIVDKKAANAKVESLLVLDSTLGQNGLRQAQVFSEAAKLSGVVLTKLDGTAKGGVALAVVHQLGLPIRFIGAGEGIEDLRPFSSYEFVEALLSG